MKRQPTWAEVILAAVLAIAAAYGLVSVKQAQQIMEGVAPVESSQ